MCLGLVFWCCGWWTRVSTDEDEEDEEEEEDEGTCCGAIGRDSKVSKASKKTLEEDESW